LEQTRLHSPTEPKIIIPTGNNTQKFFQVSTPGKPNTKMVLEPNLSDSKRNINVDKFYHHPRLP